MGCIKADGRLFKPKRQLNIVLYERRDEHRVSNYHLPIPSLYIIQYIKSTTLGNVVVNLTIFSYHVYSSL